MIYGIALPCPEQEVAQACKLVVSANGLTDCYLRPLVFLGEGANPVAARYRTAVIATTHGPLIGEPKREGVTARVSSFRRMSADSIPPRPPRRPASISTLSSRSPRPCSLAATKPSCSTTAGS